MKIYRKNYTLVVRGNGTEIKRISTHSIRLFLRHLRTINFKKPVSYVFIKVSYGKRINNFGEEVVFYNEGQYENEHDLKQAFQAFNMEV